MNAIYDCISLIIPRGFFQAGSIANGKADKFRGQICLRWMKIIAEIQKKKNYMDNFT